MARYNEILVGRYNRHFQKLLSMKGEPPAPQLSTEIQPNLQLFSGVEERYTQGWDSFGKGLTAPAVVGQTTNVRVRNPLASGVVVVFQKIMIGIGTAGGINVWFGASGSDENVVSVAGAALDLRGRPNSATVFSSNSAAPVSTASLAAIAVYALLANTSVDVIFTQASEIPLLPGSVIVFQTGAAN